MSYVCHYCKQKIEKGEEYAKVSTRYVHKRCEELERAKYLKKFDRVCFYCRQTVNIETDENLKVNSKRYAHLRCYEEKMAKEEAIAREKAEKEKEKAEKEKEKAEKAKKVEKEKTPKEKKVRQQDIKKCYYCGNPLNIAEEEFRKPVTNRYAHLKCYEKNYQPDDSFIEEIYKLLKELGGNYQFLQCEKQRQQFVQKFGYTNEGIYYALKYYYFVEKGDYNKSEGRIGIVPYVYDRAKSYYNNLEKEQKAIGKVVAAQKKENPIQMEIKKGRKSPKKKYIDLNSLEG